MKKTQSTLSRLIGMSAKYRAFLVISTICSILMSLLALAVPVVIGQAIDYAIGMGKVDFTDIVTTLVLAGIIAIAYSIFGWIANVANNHMSYEIVYQLRSRAAHKIAKLPLKYLDSRPKGEVLSAISTDAEIVGEGLQLAFTNLASAIATIIGALVVMFIYNWLIALIVLVLTPISIFVASRLSKATYSTFTASTKARAEQTAIIERYVSGRKLVAAFSREKEVVEDFDTQNEEVRSISLRSIFLSSLTNPSTRLINNIIYAIIAAGGAFSVIARGMSVGGLTTFLAYSVQYTKPLNEISGVVTEIQNGIACAAGIFKLLDQPEETPDNNASLDTSLNTHGIQFDNVSFGYTAEKTLINNLNLDIKPGEHIAIVGPTGCGKTTLINLLMRFYDVSDGAIKIDGVDIRDISRSTLRGMFGMVLQDTWLSHGTVADNIAYGKSDATREEIIEAAKFCHAHNFISRLPQGYDTVIGGEDDGLSGGQKQLICITRVMLRHPQVLILDEATSSVDTATEKRVQRAFEKICEGKTSFIVAHRLSTITDCDRILVMRDGDIVEEGSHNELLAKGGFYTELYNSRIV